MFVAVYNRGANNNKNSSKVKLKLWIIGKIIGILGLVLLNRLT